MTVSKCDPGYIFEEDIRLSESTLWNLLRCFFAKQGVTAWSEGLIPWRVTNNAFIAAAYARVVRAYLEDLAADGAASGYDPARPVRVLELGAGTGRFGFLFLRSFLSSDDASRPDPPKIRYILTDVAESNLKFWTGHPKLAKYVAAGVLDFAIFDAAADGSATLRMSGETLSDGTAANPLVAIANYVFDSLPQDVFRSLGGKLHESRLTLVSPREENDPGDLSIVERVEYRYRNVPSDGSPYADAAWNAILGDCAARGDDVPVLFPMGALSCLRALSRIGGGRMLLLSSDVESGFGGESSGGADPVPKRYGGSFFLPVDYRGLGLYAAGRGGFSLHAPARHVNMQTAALVFGGRKEKFRRTCAAFAREVADFGPADYHTLDDALRKGAKPPELPEALAFLRLSGFEPWTFHHLSDVIIEGVEKARLPLREAAAQAMVRVAENDYPVGDGQDVCFSIGRVFWRLGRYAEALRYYGESLETYGGHHVTHYNMGLCHHMEGRFDEAIRCYERCLAMDDGYAPAKQWKARAESERGDRAEEPKLQPS